MGLFDKIFGNYSEKEVKRIRPIVDKINSLEPEISKLTDKELTAKTVYFKKELAKGKTLDDILPEAFAVVREASKRVLGMRHFDVQLIGGIILHQGRISEMKTGEGKTLVATLPVYLNALTGKGVHVITVNEYLAKRDSEWMGKVYRFLGLSVGLIYGRMDHTEKQKAYNSDITYGTNNEFGFDYLRDNMASSPEQLVQRPVNYAIIDEVDSILIDEARTPLIISGRLDKSAETYKLMAKIAPQLEKDKDYYRNSFVSYDKYISEIIINGEDIELDLSEYEDLRIAYINIDDYIKFVESINDYEVTTKIDGNKKIYNYKAEKDTSVLIPINYDESLVVKVNDKKVDYKLNVYNMISIDMKKGDNKIEISYEYKNVKEGIIIFVISCLL